MQNICDSYTFLVTLSLLNLTVHNTFCIHYLDEGAYKLFTAAYSLYIYCIYVHILYIPSIVCTVILYVTIKYPPLK